MSGQSLSTGAKVGIGVGVSWAVFAIVVALYLLNHQRSWHRRQTVMKNYQPTSNKRAAEKSQAENTRSTELKVKENLRDRLNSMSSSNIDSCKGFLSVYGQQGVWLQELLSLVGVMSFSAGGIHEDRHWSQSGLRYSGPLSNYDLYLLDLLKEVSSTGELRALEQKLVSCDVLEVGTSLSEAYKDPWDLHGRELHGRLWLAKPPSTVKSIVLCQNLMGLYLRIPDRDIHMLAERHREVCYYHAHIAIEYVFQMVHDSDIAFRDYGDDFFHAFFDVAVQVLSYRYHEKDARILNFIKRFTFSALVASSEPIFFHSEDRSLFHFRRVMLYLADLKAIMSQLDVQKHTFDLCLVQEKLKYLQNTIPRGHEIGYKAWGMIGYAQADLMDIAERAHHQEAIDEILRLMREWCDTALASRTPIELAALCCVLVRLRAFQELYRIPRGYHLMCGHYLTRSGMQKVASNIILSGIRYCEQETPKEPIWRYYLEFWTIAMSQGYQDEAESWLSSASKDIWRRSRVLPDGGPEVWLQFGEFEEYSLTLATLLSDCYVAQGHYQAAASMLLMAIENTSPSHDNYITSTRVALWSRLLNIQMEFYDLKKAGILAATLCYELGEQATSHLALQTVSWAAQEVLSCANELIRAGMHGEGYHILCLLRQSMLSPNNGSASVDVLPDDLITYIKQRWDEARSIFDPAYIIQEKHNRAIYKLGQLELLTAPVGKLYRLGELDLLATSPKELCAVADPLAHFLSEHPPSIHETSEYVNSLTDSLKDCFLDRHNQWRDNDMREFESLMSEVRATTKPAVSVSEEAPATTSDSPTILDIARHIARDQSSMFLEPVRMTKGVSTRIPSEIPKKVLFPTPGLARRDKMQQLFQNKRREVWLMRRRNNFRRLLHLRKPPENIISPSVNDLERGEKSGGAITADTSPETAGVYSLDTSPESAAAYTPAQVYELAA